MDPKLAKRLMEDSKDVRAFVKFLQREYAKLDTLDGIDGETAEKIAVEVRAREVAIDKLKDILGPLINTQTGSKFSNKEYEV